jgi:hypothetical protein
MVSIPPAKLMPPVGSFEIVVDLDLIRCFEVGSNVLRGKVSLIVIRL